tara:strand:+ start:88 stop:351 length:264 start_codon:yes stop_codon:yes gene_type:complete
MFQCTVESRPYILQIPGSVSTEDPQILCLLNSFQSSSCALMIVKFGESNSKRTKGMPNTFREWKKNGLEEGQRIMNINEVDENDMET